MRRVAAEDGADVGGMARGRSGARKARLYGTFEACYLTLPFYHSIYMIYGWNISYDLIADMQANPLSTACLRIGFQGPRKAGPYHPGTILAVETPMLALLAVHLDTANILHTLSIPVTGSSSFHC